MGRAAEGLPGVILCRLGAGGNCRLYDPGKLPKDSAQAPQRQGVKAESVPPGLLVSKLELLPRCQPHSWETAASRGGMNAHSWGPHRCFPGWGPPSAPAPRASLPPRGPRPSSGPCGGVRSPERPAPVETRRRQHLRGPSSRGPGRGEGMVGEGEGAGAFPKTESAGPASPGSAGPEAGVWADPVRRVCPGRGPVSSDPARAGRRPGSPAAPLVHLHVDRGRLGHAGQRLLQVSHSFVHVGAAAGSRAEPAVPSPPPPRAAPRHLSPPGPSGGAPRASNLPRAARHPRTRKRRRQRARHFRPPQPLPARPGELRGRGGRRAGAGARRPRSRRGRCCPGRCRHGQEAQEAQGRMALVVRG